MQEQEGRREERRGQKKGRGREGGGEGERGGGRGTINIDMHSSFIPQLCVNTFYCYTCTVVIVTQQRSLLTS